MSVTPLQVYLVLQLDNIGSALSMCFGLLLASCLAVIIITRIGAFTSIGKEDRDDWKTAVASSRWMVPVAIISAVILLLVGALLPSSRTAAAAIVVPSIIQSDVVQKDLPELYQLGVDAMKSCLSPEKK